VAPCCPEAEAEAEAEAGEEHRSQASSYLGRVELSAAIGPKVSGEAFDQAPSVSLSLQTTRQQRSYR
jgi:hypothetical protein